MAAIYAKEVSGGTMPPEPRTGALPSRPVREAIFVIGLFTALTVGMTYPFVLHLHDGLPGDLGDPLLNAWILAWDADRLAEGLRGLWQAPIFYPFPDTLSYSEHLLGIAVLVAPVQWLFGNFVLTYNTAFLFSYVLAGSGMYLLVRSLTANRWAGVLAGIAFAFCPYRVAQIYHLQVLMSGWMPIGLWALHRYHVSGSRRALAGFTGAFIMQGLSNGYYLYFFSLPVTVVGCYALWRPRHDRWRMVRELGVAALGVLAVFAPIALVYYRVRRSNGFVRGIDEVAFFSPDLAGYLHVDQALFLWGRWLGEGTPEGQLFAGLVVTALAALALVRVPGRSSGHDRRSSEPAYPGYPARAMTWLYAGIACLAVVLSLGPAPTVWGTPIFPIAPYRLLMMLVPGLDGLRAPARLAMVVYLAVSVLAGIGVAAWFPRLRVHVRNGLGVALSALILLEGFGDPTRVELLQRDDRSFDAAVYDWLGERAPGAVLELPMEGRHRNLQTNHTLQFQYRTLEHGHPLVNGFSGYSSSLVGFLPVAPMWHTADTPELLQGLRSLGVRYVIVHEALYVDPDVGAATTAALRAQYDQVAAVHSVGTTHVFELGDVTWPYEHVSLDSGDEATGPSGDWRRLDSDMFTAQASHAAASLSLAFDGDVETRWSTGVSQTGTESVTLRFDRPRAIARVRLELTSGTWGDYPRHLRIESSAGGDTFDSVLFDDRVLPTLIAALPRGGKSLAIDFDLPPNRSAVLRLRQLETVGVWRWTINEMTLWERESTGP
jgi:hypothetical protein